MIRSKQNEACACPNGQEAQTYQSHGMNPHGMSNPAYRGQPHSAQTYNPVVHHRPPPVQSVTENQGRPSLDPDSFITAQYPTNS